MRTATFSILITPKLLLFTFNNTINSLTKTYRCKNRKYPTNNIAANFKDVFYFGCANKLTISGIHSESSYCSSEGTPLSKGAHVG